VTSDHVIALDLGQAGEFTALAVVEAKRDAEALEVAVRHLVRFPPGTPYAQVAQAVRSLREAKPLADAPLIVDVTAVGTKVLPLFRDEEDSSTSVASAILTAGHHAEWDLQGSWLVPRKDLVTLLQMLLQSRRLQVPAAIPEAQLLARELATYQPRVKLNVPTDGVDWRSGADDDLVLAVGLACWHAEKFPPESPGGVVILPRLGPFAHPDICQPGARR
jgi:hypothetical protein